MLNLFRRLENKNVFKLGPYTFRASKLGAVLGGIGAVLMLLANQESMGRYYNELFALACLVGVAGFMLISRPITLVFLGLSALVLLISLLLKMSIMV